MTTEEAIKTIETAKKFAYDECYEKAFDIAINALEQEPCEDAVSRKAVDSLVWEYLTKATDENIAFYEHFLDLPSVIPQEPKTKGSYHPIISGNAQNPPKVKSAEIDNTIIHAKWIERDTDEDWWIECSNCGCGQSYYDDTNYCPHCGARMDKEKEI